MAREVPWSEIARKLQEAALSLQVAAKLSRPAVPKPTDSAGGANGQKTDQEKQTASVGLGEWSPDELSLLAAEVQDVYGRVQDAATRLGAGHSTRR
jgi:hypothetical protein